MRFKTKTIGEVAEVQTGPFGSQLHKEDYVEAGTPIVTVEHLGQRRFSTQNLPRVKDCDRDRLLKYTLKTGDLVFSRVGSVDRISFVTDDENGWMFSGRCLRLRVFGEIDALWLYYFFCLEQTKQFVRNIAVGATMPSINTKLLSEVPVSYPENIADQRKIASILSLIDDKIELNSTINHNLQQQAQAIFQSWFVDFSHWGNTPPDWEQGVFSDYVTVKRGGSPRPIQDYLSAIGYRWLKISDVTSLQTPYITTIAEHIKESGIGKTVFLKSGSLVLSNSATPGIPKILDVDSCIHDGWLYFPQSEFSNEFLLLFFLQIRPKLVALGNGSVFTNLKTDILKSYPISKPPKEVLEEFDNIVKPLFSTILLNTRQNNHLICVRDSLLPKLMSGEIDVSQVEV